MSVQQIRTCDQCGCTHKENMWFNLGRHETKIGFYIVIETGEHSTGYCDACGEECALKLVSRLLRGETVRIAE